MDRSSELPGGASRCVELESARLIAALGLIQHGGVIEAVADSEFSERDENTPVEIGVSMWPWPPETTALDALASLGYRPVPGNDEQNVLPFVHEARRFDLYLMEAGSEYWTAYRALHAYCCASPDSL